MKSPHRYSWMIRLIGKVLKYFVLSLFSLGITCLLLAVFGVFSVVGILMSFLDQWLIRITVVVVCLLATAVIFESMR